MKTCLKLNNGYFCSSAIISEVLDVVCPVVVGVVETIAVRKPKMKNVKKCTHQLEHADLKTNFISLLFSIVLL